MTSMATGLIVCDDSERRSLKAQEWSFDEQTLRKSCETLREAGRAVAEPGGCERKQGQACHFIDAYVQLDNNT